jgi:dTDP-D-glucose 4,6-dehydratase
MKGPDVNPDYWMRNVEDKPFNKSRSMIDFTSLNGLGWNLNENFGELLDETVKWDLDNPD